MTDRISSGFHPFVIPFLAGMAFVLLYCVYGIWKICRQLTPQERKKFFVSLVTPSMAWKNVKDIFLNCLIHVRLWKRNRMLGFMHSSIAFGWFMLIVLGHLEVAIFLPDRLHLPYYPIFFNYFVAETDSTIGGVVLFYLMDFFLLLILCGIAIAIVKRFRSHVVGMRRTMRPSLPDIIGLYSLWAIFPLRLLAEGFTAHISGGSFLTIPLNWMFRQFMGNDMNILPTWWAYSISLGVFMCIVPFSRYMHIPAEMMLIPMRNAGLKIRHARRGFGRVEIYSCPGCGVCIDACPMSASKSNLKDCTVYLNRQLRRDNERRIEQISDKCLLCGKCEQVCQVGCEGHTLRLVERSMRSFGIEPTFEAVNTAPLQEKAKGGRLIYFSGCMTALTPRISSAVESVLKKAGVDYVWMDRDGGLCCGRPMLTAGRTEQARQLIEKNTSIIMASGADTLLLSCPICYKIFFEQYKLPGIRVVHHSVYINDLVRSGRLQLEEGCVDTICYHDPCELGRGCGIYEQPRQLLKGAGHLVEAQQNRQMSVCCGGSLGSLTLSFADREAITRASLDNLTAGDPDIIATACPLCLSTYSRYSDRPVEDIAEIIDRISH